MKVWGENMTKIFQEKVENWVSSQNDVWEDVLVKSGDLPGSSRYFYQGIVQFTGSNKNNYIEFRTLLDGEVVPGSSYKKKLLDTGEILQYITVHSSSLLEGDNPHTIKIQCLSSGAVITTVNCAKMQCEKE